MRRLARGRRRGGAGPDRIRQDPRGAVGPDLRRAGLPGVVHLTEARTPQEIAFEQAVRAGERRVLAFDADLQREIAQLVAGFRRELDGVLARTEWDAYRLDQVRRDLDASRRRLDAGMSAMANRQATEAATLALTNVDTAARALIGGAPLQAARLPFDQIALIQQLTPDLITGATQEATRRIQTILSQRVMGGLTARDARQRIGQVVGNLPGRGGRGEVPGKMFTDLQLRTETIMRTEMNRLYNLTSEGRIDDLASRMPGIGKTWIHQSAASRNPRPNHAAMNGKVVFPGEGEKFELIGKDAVYHVDGPHDPELPAEETINCHCRVRIAYDAEVAAAQRRRGDFERTPTGPAPSRVVAR